MTGPVRFVVDGALDQPTGGYIYDRIVVDGLRERGLEVEVVSLRERSLLGPLTEARRVLALLDREGTVLIDELCHPRVLLAAIPGRFRRRARLVTLVHHLGASERSGLAAAARLALERPLLQASDGLIVTSETTRSAVIAAGAGGRPVRVVRPGCDRLGMRLEEPPPTTDRVRLLFVGALTPRKEVLGLIAAHRAVADRADLTVVGPADRDPAYAAAVIREAANGAGVRLTGAVGDEELRRELDRSDVLVLPSRHEGFGIVLVEAIAHGLAVIASDAGAIPEVVRDGREALLFPAGRVDALARAIERVVSDPALLAGMKRAAREVAMTLPTWADTKRSFAEALASIG